MAEPAVATVRPDLARGIARRLPFTQAVIGPPDERSRLFMVRRVLQLSGAAAILISLLAGVGYAQDRSMRGGSSKPAKATASAPVNLNTATTAELRTLPNIGPATAARIIEYRQKNGGFKKIEDLMNVKGIGEKSFLKLRPLVTVDAAKPAER